jgi:hypothetical protein
VAEHQLPRKKAAVVTVATEPGIPAPLELLTPEAVAAVAIQQAALAALASSSSNTLSPSNLS